VNSSVSVRQPEVGGHLLNQKLVSTVTAVDRPLLDKCPEDLINHLRKCLQYIRTNSGPVCYGWLVHTLLQTVQATFYPNLDSDLKVRS
jgi:hypothetical protein